MINEKGVAQAPPKISFSTIDAKGKILVLTVDSKEDYEDAAHMVGQAYDSLLESGCIFSIILGPDMTIETLDEEQMNMHGWTKTSSLANAKSN